MAQPLEEKPDALDPYERLVAGGTRVVRFVVDVTITDPPGMRLGDVQLEDRMRRAVLAGGLGESTALVVDGSDRPSVCVCGAPGNWPCCCHNGEG